MTWYSNETQIIVMAIYFLVLIVVIVGRFFIEDSNLTFFVALLLLLVTTLGLFKYITESTAKQNEVLTSKYKYKIEIFKGKNCDTYYTNEFKIKNGIVYFNNRCANNFSIETLK